MSGTNVPPPDDPNFPRWADQKAEFEVENWADEGKFKGQKAKNDLLWLRVCLIVVGIMVVLSIVFAFGVLSWAWHNMAPTDLFWLTPEQLSKIQSVIFSGSVGGVVTMVVQKQISK
ncbi:MAG: hypothetical protein ACKVGZ_02090 [Alphaproteobacteria bacterium]|jgi:hypothetical protein